MCMLVQVDAAYLEYGPDHNIVAFMQSLGYSDSQQPAQMRRK